MIVRTLVAGVAVLAALAAPASADPDNKQGHNNGDEGLIAFVYDTVDATANGIVGAQCEYHQQPLPNSSRTVLVVQGHAHVLPNGTSAAVSVGVRCRVRNVHTDVVHLDHRRALSSNNGMWVPPQAVESTAGLMEICGAVKVEWDDTTSTGGLDDDDLVCEQPA